MRTEISFLIEPRDNLLSLLVKGATLQRALFGVPVEVTVLVGDRSGIRLTDCESALKETFTAYAMARLRDLCPLLEQETQNEWFERLWTIRKFDNVRYSLEEMASDLGKAVGSLTLKTQEIIRVTSSNNH